MSSICRSTDSEAFQPIGKPILATSSAKKRNFSIEMVQGISNHWLTVCTTFNNSVLSLYCHYGHTCLSLPMKSYSPLHLGIRPCSVHNK